MLLDTVSWAIKVQLFPTYTAPHVAHGKHNDEAIPILSLTTEWWTFSSKRTLSCECEHWKPIARTLSLEDSGSEQLLWLRHATAVNKESTLSSKALMALKKNTETSFQQNQALEPLWGKVTFQDNNWLVLIFLPWLFPESPEPHKCSRGISVSHLKSNW